MPEIGFERILQEAFDLRQELKINDSSVYALNEELKKQSVLAAEFLILLRLASKKLNTLEQQKEILIAKIIKKICDEAIEKGKPIASSAKAQLIKTDIPLYTRYKELIEKINDAQEDVNFLRSLQYIISKRGELLQDILKIDRQLIKDQMILNSENGHVAQCTLFEKKIKEMTEDMPNLKKLFKTI